MVSETKKLAYSGLKRFDNTKFIRRNNNVWQLVILLCAKWKGAAVLQTSQVKG